jgi:hypothetical protein
MTRYNRNTLLVGIAVAVVIGGALSYFASPAPDGLERTQEELGTAEPVYAVVDVPPVAFNEYNFKWLGDGFWANAAAGTIGSLLVLAIVLGLGRLLARRRPPVTER